MKNNEFKAMLNTMETFVNMLDGKLNEFYDSMEIEDFDKEFGKINEIIITLRENEVFHSISEISDYINIETEEITGDYEFILSDMNTTI